MTQTIQNTGQDELVETQTKEELKEFIRTHKESAIRNNRCMFCGKRVRKKLNFGEMTIWKDGYHNSCMNKKWKEVLKE